MNKVIEQLPIELLSVEVLVVLLVLFFIYKFANPFINLLVSNRSNNLENIKQLVSYYGQYTNSIENRHFAYAVDGFLKRLYKVPISLEEYEYFLSYKKSEELLRLYSKTFKFFKFNKKPVLKTKRKSINIFCISTNFYQLSLYSIYCTLGSLAILLARQMFVDSFYHIALIMIFFMFSVVAFMCLLEAIKSGIAKELEEKLHGSIQCIT